MSELCSEYYPEFDSIDKAQWYDKMEKFEDANIYQTWSYDAIRHGEKNISHFILKKNGNVVAAAQARLLAAPVIGHIMAYIRWAPMWKLRGEEISTETFRQAVRALRDEYVVKRGLVLRLRPALFKDNADEILGILAEEGYTKLAGQDADRTLLMDLRPPLQAVRKSSKERWRNYLNRAERDDFEIIEGFKDDLFGSFVDIYKEMLRRKNFAQPNDINEFRSIQKDLPDEFKMSIMLSRVDGKVSNGIICSGIGNTGVYLFGATSNAGLNSRGAYLLQWKMIEWLKQRGHSYYDLNGINPQRNPGTYQFKAGLSGKNGQDVYFVGQFDAYPNIIGQVIVKWADKFRARFGQWKRVVKGALPKGQPTG